MVARPSQMIKSDLQNQGEPTRQWKYRLYPGRAIGAKGRIEVNHTRMHCGSSSTSVQVLMHGSMAVSSRNFLVNKAENILSNSMVIEFA